MGYIAVWLRRWRSLEPPSGSIHCWLWSIRWTCHQTYIGKEFHPFKPPKKKLLKPFQTGPFLCLSEKKNVAVNSSWAVARCNVLALHAFTLLLAPVWLESQTNTWQWRVKLLCDVQAASLGANTASFQTAFRSVVWCRHWGSGMFCFGFAQIDPYFGNGSDQACTSSVLW